ncbi:MAG TPA: hypothetical protein ENJ82_03470, partial [Bacteroidetes bacterium]|nr:hypothetical protein [Bacteroidota bacterium]
MWIIRKCFPVFIGLISLLLLNKPVNVQASHAQGLDLTYVCLGGNEYRFTLNLYRDCSGIIVSNATTIFLSSVSCGVSFSTPLSLISGPVEVSPLCVAQLGQSTCASLPPCTMPCLPGVEQYTYQGTFTFTQNCTDWIVSFEECCRNVAITNLAAPASQSLFVSASLNNAGGLCNNSPIFTSSPVPYICANQLFCYNHGAYDADGDSLVYSLVAPLDGPAPGTPISYSSGLLSPGYPLHDTRGMIDFDPLTGSMCVNPTVTLPGQVAVIAVEVAEYRSGVRIGTIIRDIQMVVLQCGNNQPRQNPQDISNVVNAVRTDSNSVEACPGVPLSFAVMFDDIDLGDVISVNSNIALVCAGANMTTVGTNPVVATFSWLPAANQTGYYNFTVTIQDDGCPILGTQIFNFDILVSPGTSAGPDVSYCPGGSPVPLLARGGTNFNWSVITGGPGNLTCTNCANPRATPGDSVLLEVISNLSPGCKNRDTIRVNVVPSFLLDAGSDTTICRYGLAQFNALATPAGPGFSPYTYVWSPADSLSNVNTANAAANPLDSTRYYLAVTAANGCTITDSVDVNINGIAPRILAKPVDTICENAPLALLTTVFQDCGPTSNACSGPLSTA